MAGYIPYLFSSTFKGLELFSSKFKHFQGFCTHAMNPVENVEFVDWNSPSWYLPSLSTTVQCGLCAAWLHWTSWSQTWATVVRLSTVRVCELWSSLWNINSICTPSHHLPVYI